jgi:hypothetical protein
MATFTFHGEYVLGSAFWVQDPFFSEPAVTLSNGQNGDTFSVGESVTITYSDGVVYTDTIVAFTSDGIVTTDGEQQFLYTSNPNYEVGTYLITNQDPFNPVCFVKGTLIDTDRGPVAIESLEIGDKVIGSKGLGTVKWVGRRYYSALFLDTAEKRRACMPVRISIGALGENMPSQDLCVSPWHHLLVDGQLVRAGDLINDITIVQEKHLTQVAYYHVELDQFDVVMAHGVYSESWADGGNRDFFQNVDVTSLRPEDKIRRRASRPGFDHLVLRDGSKLRSIQARLVQRAQQLHGELHSIKAA